MKTQSESKVIETTPEVKAYVYQRLQDFSPYLNDKSETGVVIQKLKADADHEGFLVHLSISTEGGSLAATGEGNDVFSAIARATDHMMAQVSAIHNITISNRERDLEIRQASSHSYLH